jgi:hypothetical protein
MRFLGARCDPSTPGRPCCRFQGKSPDVIAFSGSKPFWLMRFLAPPHQWFLKLTFLKTQAANTSTRHSKSKPVAAQSGHFWVLPRRPIALSRTSALTHMWHSRRPGVGGGRTGWRRGRKRPLCQRPLWERRWGGSARALLLEWCPRLQPPPRQKNTAVDRNQQRPGCARGNGLLHSKHSHVVLLVNE